jgi:protein-S-isoprenylcysteine O-methyltransferase Ste14
MSWIGGVLGWPLIVVGIWVSVWAAKEAGVMNIESPTKLLTAGLAANSVWIVALLPAAVVFTHLVDIRREERILKAEFGDQYLEYQERVRRYF